jgi:hypothetical protein
MLLILIVEMQDDISIVGPFSQNEAVGVGDNSYILLAMRMCEAIIFEFNECRFGVWGDYFADAEIISDKICNFRVVINAELLGGSRKTLCNSKVIRHY